MQHELTREMARPVVITHRNPHELMALVRDRRLVVTQPMALVAPGLYGVVVLSAAPIRVRRGPGALPILAGALVVLAGAAVAIGWWSQHGMPLLCALFVAGAVTLTLVVRRVSRT